MNTVDKRDILEDEHSPLSLFSDGQVGWSPGSVFPTSCELELTKFPFDKQSCNIMLASMMHGTSELQFSSMTSEAAVDVYSSNSGWELLSTRVETGNLTMEPSFHSSALVITFNIQRRPTVLLLTVILPIIVISFLNLLVFIIPVDSGEKLGFGVTCLLALAVFLSIVSEMMPSSATNIPVVTVYLFVLLVLSSLTVFQTIVVVWLHHKEEKVAKHEEAKKSFTQIFRKFVNVGAVVKPWKGGNQTQLDHGVEKQDPIDILKTFSNAEAVEVDMEERNSQGQAKEREDQKMSVLEVLGERKKMEKETKEDSNILEGNKYKILVKNIDMISFCVFLALWGISSFIFVMAIAF